MAGSPVRSIPSGASRSRSSFYLLIPVIAAFGGRRALRVVSVLVLAISYWSIYRYSRVTWTGRQRYVDRQSWCSFNSSPAAPCSLSCSTAAFRAGTGLFACSPFASALACWVVAQVCLRRPRLEALRHRPRRAFAGWAAHPARLRPSSCSPFSASPADRIPKSIAYLGRISFGLYVYHSLVYLLLFRYLAPLLWHGPEKDFAVHPRIVWLVVRARPRGPPIAIAQLSYRLLERPFLLLKTALHLRPLAPRIVRPAGPSPSLPARRKADPVIQGRLRFVFSQSARRDLRLTRLKAARLSLAYLSLKLRIVGTERRRLPRLELLPVAVQPFHRHLVRRLAQQQVPRRLAGFRPPAQLPLPLVPDSPCCLPLRSRLCSLRLPAVGP